MRTITLEEHFVTKDFLQAVQALVPDSPYMQALRPKLLDLGEGRIAAMDEAGIDLQVLSLAAIGMDKVDIATSVPLVGSVNDEAAAAVRANPTRFAALATLPMHDPDAAARELQRSVDELGMKGAIIDGTTGGVFLDDPRFTPVLEAAVSLGVPIYLHPAPPPEPVQEAYYRGLPSPLLDQSISMAGWGWHVETGLHVLRLIVAGVFDRYPTLQVIIGHMGEDLPYSLVRAETVLTPVAKHLERRISDYFHSNIHVTTSGYFSNPPFLCALQVVGADRLLFSVDYPFSANTLGRKFLDGISVSPEDFAKISHGNAERLLKL